MTKAAHISVARVHDEPGVEQRARLLVDRLWPRGIGKAELALDDWIREVAPSSDLRKWFNHDPAKWDEFRHRYRTELDDNDEAVERCLVWCRKGLVVLLYGAKDRDHNQAVVLKDFLRKRMAREDEK